MNISASTGPLSLCLPSSPSTITPQPHSSLAIEPFNRTTPVISPFNPAQIEDIYPHVIVHEKGLLPTGEQDNSPERIFYIIGEKLRAYLINPLGNVTQKIGRTTQSVISTLSNALPSFPVAYAADVPLVHIEHGDTIYTAGIPIEKKLRNEIIESANFIWEKHPIVFLGEIHTDPSSIQIRQALQEGAINQKFRCFTEGISTHNHNGLLFGLALPEDVYMKTRYDYV
jgi:hypothetical protein